MDSSGILVFSETGNTEMIARAVSRCSGIENIVSLDQLTRKEFHSKSRWFIGLPVHGDNLPEKFRELFQDKIASADPSGRKQVALFYTHTGPMGDPSYELFQKHAREWCLQYHLELTDFFHCRGENRRPDVGQWLKENMPGRYENTKTAIGLPGEGELEKAEAWTKSILHKWRKTK